MEIKPRTSSGWTIGSVPSELANSKARSILFFGPDQGGVFEFAASCTQGVDKERIDAKEIDPGHIASLLGSGSLFGGATSVVIDGASDQHLKSIQAILEAPFVDGARMIVLAGDLKASSKLRKHYQSQDDLIGVPLYTLRDNEIQSFATQYFKSQGLSLDPQARTAIGQRLSGDRALAARACEVVALHALGRDAGSVGSVDVQAVLDTVDEDALNAPIDHALKGDPAAAVKALRLRLASGENFVAMLRFFSARLHRFRDLAASGLSPRDAVAKARPPIFWTEKDMITRMLATLSVAKIDRMLERLDRTEHQIIEEGVAAEITLGQMLIEFAHHKGWRTT